MKKTSIYVARVIFMLISVLFTTLYTAGPLTAMQGKTSDPQLLALSISCGLAFSLVLIGFDKLLQNVNLRSLNLASLGLAFGLLLGQIVNLLFASLLHISGIEISGMTVGMTQSLLFVFTSYLGVIMTLRASQELNFCIPFISFESQNDSARKILLDNSALSDPRLLDLASSGLLDERLVLAEFTYKDLQTDAESTHENNKSRAKKSLELIHKLENMPQLKLSIEKSKVCDSVDQSKKLFKLAKQIKAHILSAEAGHLETCAKENIRLINIHALANCLKPLMQAGESLTIKVQRCGKEVKQGVGYLEDGTMVVINGGGDFIGENIKTQVLSIKHTSSGRMIFCNACIEEKEALTKSPYLA